MSATTALVPTGSQTVGPFFSIGLNHLIDRAPTRAAGSITIQGQVFDGDGAGVPDAMLEFWSPAEAAWRCHEQSGHPQPTIEARPQATSGSDQAKSGEPLAEPTDPATGYAAGFRRVATDGDGKFRVTLLRPKPAAWPDGRLQAPHLLVLVFARGLLRHLLTRVYCADEEAISSDPLLQKIPAERRGTLVAQAQGPSAYGWNIILQGQNETVFFAW